MGKLWIGTSGWSYKDWNGPFYPKGLPHTQWFEHYCRHFPTVEMNVTFYRMPAAATVEKWRDESPPDFIFAIKMSRLITHLHRLKEVSEPLDRFLEMADHFGRKLGVILIQLPPSLTFHADTTDEFFEMLREKDPHRPYALECRHPTWFQDEVYERLHRQGIALCVADSGGGFPPHEALTAPFVYVRFHGPGARYASKYNDRELSAAAAKIHEWLEQRDVYVYFNNDTQGYAVENAFKLREMLNRLPAGRSAG